MKSPKINKLKTGVILTSVFEDDKLFITTDIVLNIDDVLKFNICELIISDIYVRNMTLYYYCKILDVFSDDGVVISDDLISATFIIDYNILDRENTKIDKVNHPKYYNQYSIEVIDMMIAIWGVEKMIDFCEINAFKYRTRLGIKGNTFEEDLAKEQWYLAKANELRKLINK